MMQSDGMCVLNRHSLSSLTITRSRIHGKLRGTLQSIYGVFYFFT